MSSSRQQEFMKEFSKATTYGLLDKLTARAEQNMQKKHLRATLENLQNKVNEMFAPQD